MTYFRDKYHKNMTIGMDKMSQTTENKLTQLEEKI